MAGGSLWEGLQQAPARQEQGLWEGLTAGGTPEFRPSQPIEDRMAWRMIPPSRNIEDRRREGLTLADIAQKVMMWLNDDRSGPLHSQNPNMSSAADGGEISNTMDQIKFGTVLRNMNRHADANAANEAWLQSTENPR